MKLFQKQIKFVSAICPECKGNLQLDANLETAFCQYCGAQCIVENAPRKEKKQNKLETVLDFVERQQSLRRQDKREKRRRQEKEDKETKEHFQKNWWKYLVGFISLFTFIFILAILENYGII